MLNCSTLPIQNAQVTRALKRPDGDLWLNEEKRKPKLNPRPHCLGDNQFIVFICSPNEIQFFKNLFFSWKKTNEYRRYYRLTLRQRAWVNRVWKWIYCDWCSQRIPRGSKSIDFVVVEFSRGLQTGNWKNISQLVKNCQLTAFLFIAWNILLSWSQFTAVFSIVSRRGIVAGSC